MPDEETDGVMDQPGTDVFDDLFSLGKRFGDGKAGIDYLVIEDSDDGYKLTELERQLGPILDRLLGVVVRDPAILTPENLAKIIEALRWIDRADGGYRRRMEAAGGDWADEDSCARAFLSSCCSAIQASLLALERRGIFPVESLPESLVTSQPFFSRVLSPDMESVRRPFLRRLVRGTSLAPLLPVSRRSPDNDRMTALRDLQECYQWVCSESSDASFGAVFAYVDDSSYEVRGEAAAILTGLGTTVVPFLLRRASEASGPVQNATMAILEAIARDEKLSDPGRAEYRKAIRMALKSASPEVAEGLQRLRKALRKAPRKRVRPGALDRRRPGKDPKAAGP